MSEAVHAVVAKQDHKSQQMATTLNTQNQMLTNVPNITTSESSTLTADDDDDDIDIIGKFGQHNQAFPSNNNNSLFVMTASSSVGSNNYLITNPPFSAITVPVNRITSIPSEFNVPSTPTYSPRSNNVFDCQYEANQPLIRPSSSNQFNNCNNNKMNQQSRQTASDQQPSVVNENRQFSPEWDSDSSLIPARDRLRRSLRYHFMSPFDKWKIKGRFPWKLLFQIIKIILVTSQVILFGNTITRYQSIDNGIILSLHNLFLLDWDSSHDYATVPPVTAPYVVFTKDDVYRHIDFAIKNYANISSNSIGSFGYQLEPEDNHQNPQPQLMSTIEICFRRYINATLNPSTKEYFVDLTEYENCIYIRNLYPPDSPKWSNFSFYDYMVNKLNTPGIDFESLILLVIKLPLRTILLNTPATYNTPQCYDLDLAIHFNNKAHSGEMSISMKYSNRQIKCIGNSDDHSRETHSYNIYLTVNFMVLILSLFSFILCIRSLWRAQTLRRKTARFFAVAYKRNLDANSSVYFIDGWILMILLNDCLLIVATSANIFLQFSMLGANRFNVFHPIDVNRLCSSLLGVANLLVWCGILRYLAFFSKYNILIITIKHSIPRVLRFLLCVLVLYGGFCFSGWIILGPYHYKFETLARTSECLFALMSGDDVFATFAYLQQCSLFVWWFSRLYLYSFVLLFIYVVMSLFIAILMDSYETIKDYYSNRNKRRRLIGFFANDNLLSKFILSDEDNYDDQNVDTLSNFRLNLLNDEEFEYRQSHERTATPSSSDSDHHSVSICNCCSCHCSSPFNWIRTLYHNCRTRLSNVSNQRNRTRNRSRESGHSHSNANYSDSTNRLPIN